MTMDQKRILLTGGSSGIGEQCARKLLDQGAEVIVLDQTLAWSTVLNFIRLI